MASLLVDGQPAAQTEMWRIVWADLALDRLEEISRYIGADNPAAAKRLAHLIAEAGLSLTEMLHRVRPIGRGRRELRVSGPYMLKYIVVEDEVQILTIRHAARRPEA